MFLSEYLYILANIYVKSDLFWEAHLGWFEWSIIPVLKE